MAAADQDTLLDALAANAILIERPIVLVGDRAVVARPAERALDLPADQPCRETHRNAQPDRDNAVPSDVRRRGGRMVGIDTL